MKDIKPPGGCVCYRCITTVLKCIKYFMLHQYCMQIYNESNIDINNGSVLNDKSIKAQGSDEYW